MSTFSFCFLLRPAVCFLSWLGHCHMFFLRGVFQLCSLFYKGDTFVLQLCLCVMLSCLQGYLNLQVCFVFACCSHVSTSLAPLAAAEPSGFLFCFFLRCLSSSTHTQGHFCLCLMLALVFLLYLSLQVVTTLVSVLVLLPLPVHKNPACSPPCWCSVTSSCRHTAQGISSVCGLCV